MLSWSQTIRDLVRCPLHSRKPLLTQETCCAFGKKKIINHYAQRSPWLYTFVTSHWMVHWKLAKLIVCKLYLDNTDKKNYPAMWITLYPTKLCGEKYLGCEGFFFLMRKNTSNICTVRWSKKLLSIYYPVTWVLWFEGEGCFYMHSAQEGRKQSSVSKNVSL